MMLVGFAVECICKADLAITAQNHARWAGGDEYRDTMPRLDGEVPGGLPRASAGPEVATESPHRRAKYAGSLTERGGAYWARTSDLRGVSTALYQLS
jgi:hypothetical protein